MDRRVPVKRRGMMPPETGGSISKAQRRTEVRRGTLKRAPRILPNVAHASACRRRLQPPVCPRASQICEHMVVQEAEMNRRDFLQNTAAGALTAAAQVSTAAAPQKKMIGIQVGAVSFIDEGVDPVLDRFQRDAAINTLFVATFTYGRGIAGRQVPGQPLPDHGKREYDTGTFHGGSYTKIHPQYYKNTVFK